MTTDRRSLAPCVNDADIVAQVLSFQVNDLGNVGIGYPCNAPADVPADVMFAYCSTNLPFKEQVVTRWLTVQIQAVNNPPVLFTFNTQGTVRYSNPFPSMQAVQNVTTSLNKVEVEDVDIADTPGCMMNVSIQTSRSAPSCLCSSS